MEEEKSPWVWKAVIVLFPLCLFLSIIIALFLKVSGDDQNEFSELKYGIGSYDAAGLKDSVEKLELLVGERDFSTEEGQRAMRQAAALVQGTLSPNNLGYDVRQNAAFTREGQVWRDFWVEKEGKRAGTVILQADYGEKDQSASVAALLALAEWARGRTFEKDLVLSFSTGERRLPPGYTEENATLYTVKNIGGGTQVMRQDEETETWGSTDDFVESATVWTDTNGWVDYLAQVDLLIQWTTRALNR